MYTENKAAEVYIRRLISEYNYPKGDIQREMAYSFGRARYKFDIVVMKEGKLYILVEVKTKRRPLLAAKDQLQKYLQPIKVEYAVITDGYNDECYKITQDIYDKPTLEPIPDIPAYKKTLSSIGKITEKELKIVKPKQLENIIWNILNQFRFHSGITSEDAFKKIVKVLLLKAYDEKSDQRLFRADYQEPPENIKLRLRTILEKAKKDYPEFLQDSLNLDDNILLEIVYAIQKYSIIESMKGTHGSKLFSQALGRFAYQHSSPQELVKLIIDLLSPEKGSTFIDPACGVGGLITTAASRGAHVTGIENVVDIAQFARMNLILSDLDGEIINADSLRETNLWHLKNLSSHFDYAAVVPPFALKISDDRLLGYILGSNKTSQVSEVLFLEQTLRFLREGGRMCIVVPSGFLWGDFRYEVREFMMRNSIIKAIITLPSGLFSPLSEIRTAILMLEKASEKGTSAEDQVFVANIEDIKDFDKFVKIYQEFENQEIIPDEDNVFVTRLKDPRQINFVYLQSLHLIEKRKEAFPDWSLVQLQNIARFSTGIRIKKVESGKSEEEAIYLRAGDINDLVLDLDNAERICYSRKFLKYIAKPDDILFTRAGTVGRVAIVPDYSVPLIVGSNVLQITITDRKRVLPEFLLAVLRSDYGQKQIEMFTGGSTIRAISVSGVREIMIPIPPIDEQKKMASQIERIIEGKEETKKISKELMLKEEKMLKQLNSMLGGE